MEKRQHFLAQRDEGILKLDPHRQKLRDQHYDLHEPPPA